MPWQEQCAVQLRKRFIMDWLREKRVSELSRRYQISRKTAYKWIARFREGGLQGLDDRSRRPRRRPNATCPKAVEELLKLRRRHKWSAKKLLPMLRERRPGLALPALSTACSILKRANLVQKRQRSHFYHRMEPSSYKPSTAANNIWCIDYKGHFRMKNGEYCYPLTITDEYSRFILACEAFGGICGKDVRVTLEKLFKKYGIPAAIRSDNGMPFASHGLGRLSKLSVWWLSLGIKLLRNNPACPQDNPRHERMHRELKIETTLPPELNLARQQRRFDSFRRVYNHVRPHEGLGQQRPISHYRPSNRPYPKQPKEPTYPRHFEVRRVSSAEISLWGKIIFLSAALNGQKVGLIERDFDQWTVYFGSKYIANIDYQKGQVSA